MMARRAFSVLLMAGMALTLPLASQAQGNAAADNIRFGTSSVGSTFYVLAVGISELSRKHAGINSTVEPLGGSTATINGLAAGKLDLAMSNSASAWTAYQGEAPFKRPLDIALIAQGQPSLRYIVVRNDAGIKSAADLAGKTFIAKRRALPEMEQVANALLEAQHVTKDKVRIVETVETNQTTDALRTGTAQAAIFPGGLRIAPLEEMLRDKVVDLLPLPADKAEALKNKLPSYFSWTRLPANTFENQNNESGAPTLNTYLVVRSDMSEETVYRLAKAIFGNQKEFSAYHAEAKYWTVRNTLDDAKIPFHPGAVRYFKEVGAWDAKMDALQASLARKK